MSAQTWPEVSARLGRNELPAALVTAVFNRTLVDPDEIAKGVADAWISAEWPVVQLGLEVWMRLFQKSGFIDDDGRAERPTEHLTLYRGCVTGAALGPSWTADLDKAEWFANRFGTTYGATAVFRATVAPSALLAHFARRGEDEWVLNPVRIDPTSVRVAMRLGAELQEGSNDDHH